uniref:Uncharacterized protein n=1 Tax=Arundo donax TaxID=35708 RepID=A0A0A8YE70_ARUDO
MPRLEAAYRERKSNAEEMVKQEKSHAQNLNYAYSWRT